MATAEHSILTCNDIEEDCRLVNRLVEAAKFGRWDEVWTIIGTPENPTNKAYLVNVIPQNRRWGVIHQAVYFRNAEVINKLLRFTVCDKSLQTKPCTSEKIGVTERLSPLQLAEEYGYKNIVALINSTKTSGVASTTETFQECSVSSKASNLKLLDLSLAAYKAAFHPSVVDPRQDIADVLGTIWGEMNKSVNRWVNIRDVVADSVYLFCPDYGKRIGTSQNIQQLYKQVIRVYTEESNYMYAYISTAFRKQSSKGYMPDGVDLSLGPYAVLFQMMLLFWPNIPRENRLTYRRMTLTTADIAKYKLGKRFVWTSIVSSSVLENYAVAFPTCGPEHASGTCAVLFKIDNSNSSRWQPRNIEAYATYTEKERTYPAGAKFLVTKCQTEDKTHVVYLKLLPA